MSRSNKKQAFSQLVKYIFKYWYLLLALIIFACGSVYATIMSVIYVGKAIDLMVGGVNSVNTNKLIYYCTSVLLDIGIYLICQWIVESIAGMVTHKVVRDIRRDFFNRMESLPLSYIDSKRTGEILSRMVVDVEQIADGLVMTFSHFVTGVLTIIGTIVIMMIISWKIGLIIVCITPLSLLLASFISKGTHKHFKRQSEIRGEISDKTESAVNNQTLYKVFGYQERGENAFQEDNIRLEKTSIKAVFFSSLPNPTTRFVNNIIYLLVGVVGALMAINGGLSIGSLVSFLTYSLKYAKPFNEITDVLAEIESAIASAERVFEITNAQVEIPDSPNAVVLNGVDGNLSIKDVSFSYDKSKSLIEHFNLEVESGQTIAIVGRTGCGKTTLINLLMRFYDIDSGQIIVSGNDIKKVTRDSLRKSFGMVLQDSYIFSGTIRDNIAFGYPDATDDEIIQASKHAHAYSFIKRLPNGLDTVIGENVNLSEGQKQLLCIARAMLKLPEMLILDEATSSVDTRTEIKIQRAFDEMMKNRTCFVVAHRLSTIKRADCIIVMDNGKIIEKGTHKELLKQNGFYTKLYNSQFAHN